MSFYTIETSPNEDRPGVQVWISRDDGQSISLAVAEDFGEFEDGSPVPDRIVQKARDVADSVDY